VFVLHEPRIGQRAEFDWGEVTLSTAGVWQKYCLAVLVLPFSPYRFARPYDRSNRLEVIQAQIEFFREIGSVPEAIFYDRMAVVFDSRKRQFNDKFLEFSMHFGFQPCVCNPASSNEKGTDEESVGYVQRAIFGVNRQMCTTMALEKSRNHSISRKWVVKNHTVGIKYMSLICYLTRDSNGKKRAKA
jgi:transposase